MTNQKMAIGSILDQPDTPWMISNLITFITFVHFSKGRKGQTKGKQMGVFKGHYKQSCMLHQWDKERITHYREYRVITQQDDKKMA